LIEKNKTEFAVIGAGRFGQFWARQLSRYYPVSIFDLDHSKEHQIKRFAAWQPLEICLQKKYIFMTIPIGRLQEFLIQNSQKIKAGSVVIDCASVKVPVIKWFKSYLPQDVYYVASHPLFGPDSARLKLRGHLMVMLPGQVPYREYQFLVKLLTKKLGLQIYNMTAEEHDDLMAYNLNLVHHLGRTLHDLGISRLPLMMSGLTKLNEIVSVVMNDTDELFHDFYKYNPYAGGLMQKWAKSYERISRSIVDRNNSG
jgi:prephenate dehydrogenase